MLQDYLQAYPPPTHVDAYSQIQGMAQRLEVYLGKYPAQYMLHQIKHPCQTKHLFCMCCLILTSSQLLVALGILVLVHQFKKGLY